VTITSLNDQHMLPEQGAANLAAKRRFAMLDPNYNLTVMEYMLRERQRWLKQEMKSGQQLRPFLAEKLGAIDRARRHIGEALISLGMRVQGQLPDVAQRDWASHLR
jgi:hypothetical protein